MMIIFEHGVLVSTLGANMVQEQVPYEAMTADVAGRVCTLPIDLFQ
jgi:hypothetical protein